MYSRYILKFEIDYNKEILDKVFRNCHIFQHYMVYQLYTVRIINNKTLPEKRCRFWGKSWQKSVNIYRQVATHFHQHLPLYREH